MREVAARRPLRQATLTLTLTQDLTHRAGRDPLGGDLRVHPRPRPHHHREIVERGLL
jgi:hypothetical protein